MAKKKKKYRVHGYEVIRIPVEVEATDQKAAIREYNEQLGQWDFRTNNEAEMAEETTGYLVDEVGDEEYERSKFYCADGETEAGDRCMLCNVTDDEKRAVRNVKTVSWETRSGKTLLVGQKFAYEEDSTEPDIMIVGCSSQGWPVIEFLHRDGYEEVEKYYKSILFTHQVED